MSFYAGDWSGALADGQEALALAEETGQTTAFVYARLMLASVCAGQGRPEARQHVEDAMESFARRGGHGIEAWAHGIAGFLEQGEGRPDRAVESFERVEALISENGPLHPLLTSSAPELVEAHVRLGDRGSAERWLITAEERAVSSGNSTVKAQAGRCRGLLAEPTEVDVYFKEALEWHSLTARPFSALGLELCYGERLRRDRRPSDAVRLLEAARITFIAIGAAPWRQRCEAELNACGFRPARRTCRRWPR